MRVILSLVLVMISLTTACTEAGVDRDRGASGGAGLDVVASFYPLAFAADRVGGADVAVTNLTPPGVEPHDLELRPEDLESIAVADIVVLLAGGFQPSVEDAVAAEATGVTIDASAGLDRLLPHPGEEGATDAEAMPADPHIWLDPGRYADIVGVVADALGEVAPARAKAFSANADALDAELSALDEDFRRGLAVCDTRVLITNHAAFGYLANAYDLEQVSISGVTPEAEPDPARIAELADRAVADGVTTIFTEDLVSPEVAETLAAEAGLETAVLSPLEGLTEEQIEADQDYLSVMRRNLEVLRDGLGCR